MNDLFKRRLTIILGLLFIVGGIGTCKVLKDSKKTPDRMEVITAARAVRTLTAQNGPVRLSIPITGRLRAVDRMLITAEVGGTVQRTGTTFREGVTFRKGEVLLQIDNGEVRAQVNAQQSSFLRTLVQLVPDLRIDFPDAAAKWETYLKSVPVEGLLPELPKLANEQERNYMAGRGLLDQYYGIRALYERLGKYNITAPFDGVVVSASVEPGTIVTPGTRLGEFISPGSLELETAIGAGELTLVHIGDTLRLTSTEGPGTWRGRIIRAGENIDASTQTVKLFVQVDGKDLRDGQYLAGSIEAGALSDAVAVPRSALLEDGSLYTVKDSALVKMPVEILHQGVEQAVVRGLANGQVVVTDRLSGAYEGLRVAPVTSE
ncbi:MAG TPA: HlyD family efflux transporter periplasmic adaptor subunit [Flavobacteriales bacterium]|jgi:membrane fusion protein (multidrug efflux system)|nr:HlyD family efflux transporter periplasmic adaptor subunit [Flavobacteriales bacterium]MBK7111698.1 HlyD family efflux transporter periplasmic adaptor subunit [Flavobacteriales bacterium]MBK8709460.1 HlyD family efflux transporter periplasmic adaptor subunit [Flavobacteriales bacterium]HQW05713.1 HlyD family efflux transporter periplasmic adaptor subunit [Flavobacteriales bacterium]HQW99937.1 HlyD family efflux transporter periplasmic adaptor subunit [Flavobacteriales bacterium]